MRKLVVLAAALAAFASLAAAAPAADPPAPTVVPFPVPAIGQVFVAAQTVDATGAMQNQFAPGSSVIFRARAIDAKSHKSIATKDVKYFYVSIPNQPTVKLTFDPKAIGATGVMVWTGTWKVPDTYPTGLVAFKVLVQTKAKRYGQFVQMPVTSAMLTIAAKPQTALAAGPGPTSAVEGLPDPNIVLYVDTVNGSSPVAAPKRAVGCTQTNVYKRGEQLVLRTWGFDLTTGDALTNDNVDTAFYTVPGLAPIALPYGAHGNAGAKVWFWAMFWNIPTNFPLGDVTIHVAFKTDSGKVGAYDHTVTIIP